MSPLSARTRALLDEARRSATPSPAELRRVRSRLTATLLAGVDPPAGAIGTSVLLSGLGIAAAALAGFGAWHLVHRVHALESPPVATAPSCPPVPSCPALPVPAASPGPPAALTEPVAAPLVRSAPVRARGSLAFEPELAPRQTSKALFSAPLDVAPNSDFELRLLSDARVALDAGYLLDALRHAQRHEQLFPNSLFEEERVAIQTLVFCALERPDLAEPRLDRLLKLAPNTTYLPRVRGSCGSLGDRPQGERHE